MISQIFLALENYSYVGVITDLASNPIITRYCIAKNMKSVEF
jgi:hypothetical protein